MFLLLDRRFHYLIDIRNMSKHAIDINENRNSNDRDNKDQEDIEYIYFNQFHFKPRTPKF